MIQTLNDIIHNYTVGQFQQKKLEFGFHKKQQEIMSGLNDIEGLPYIIIQSGLPSISNSLPEKWIFPKEDKKRH